VLAPPCVKFLTERPFAVAPRRKKARPKPTAAAYLSVKLNIVPARTGIQWVRLGVTTFFRQPLALAGLFFLYTMTVLLLGSVPKIGAVIAVILMPAATLGMMVATEQASQGKFPMPSVLLSAFRAGKQRARAMLVLGGIYAAVLLLISLLVYLMSGGAPAVEVNEAAGAAAGSAPVVQVKPAFFVALALQLPFIILFTHAPALVHWHGVSPIKSLFFSAICFWRNLGAFVVYGAAWVLVLSLAFFLLALLSALFGATPAPASIVPLMLMLMAMAATSMYFTFRDSFAADPEPEPEPTPPPPSDPPPGDTP
jgi:hypothetical protein